MLAILLCDSDGFHAVNERIGQQTGDEVLREVALAVQDSTRGSDLAFRWGGDEQVAVLSNTSREGVLVVAERIRRHVSRIGASTASSFRRASAFRFFQSTGRTSTI